jgi:hypothetical protein
MATVDFFGTDDFRGLVDVLLCFDDVLREQVDDDRDALLGPDSQWQKKHGGRECDSSSPEHT